MDNIKNFDFTDKEGKLQKEIDNLDAAVATLGTNWNDAIYNAKPIYQRKKNKIRGIRFWTRTSATNITNTISNTNSLW